MTRNYRNPSIEEDPQGLWEVVLSRVDRTSSPEGCWLWTGHVIRNGYGEISSHNRAVLVHRVAVIARDGAIPAGMTVDHTCHNRSASCDLGNACPHRRCVNPDHLEVVSAAENCRRAPNGSTGAPLTPGMACGHGHVIRDAGDLYFHPRGWSECRQCRSAVPHRKGKSRKALRTAARPRAA